MKEMKKIKVNFIILEVIIFIFSWSFPLQSEAGITAICHGQAISQTIVNIKAESFFPITIGSTTVESGSLPDTPNPSNPICSCGVGIYKYYGLAMGYWEPIGVIDVTRTPYCMVNFGGEKLSENDQAEGDVDTQSPDQNSGFYYVHYYNIPLLKKIMGDSFGGACTVDADSPLPYFSELDPTWNNETTANGVIFPDAYAMANMFQSNPISAVVAQAACALDTVEANTGLASDTFFWCAGSQGFMYPLTGKVAENNGVAQASTMMAERTIFKLHHLFMIGDSGPDELCEQTPLYMMQKSRYRYQMVYPANKPSEPFGRSTMLWGISGNLSNLANGDDAAFMIWRKHNCCSW
jgi:conjugal transfer pilus assembly protein TraU